MNSELLYIEKNPDFGYIWGMTNRKKQAEQTRQRIIDSALTLFNERDFESVTISEICKNAGVSTGNFYNYFENKEDILFLRYYDFDNYIQQEFVYLDFNNYLDAIRALVRTVGSYGNKYGLRIHAQIIRVQLRRDDRSTFFDNPDRPYHTHLRKLVECALKAEELHPSHNADIVAQTILRMVRGNLFDWSVRNGPYPIEEQYLADLELLFTAFSQPKPKVKTNSLKASKKTTKRK